MPFPAGKAFNDADEMKITNDTAKNYKYKRKKVPYSPHTQAVLSLIPFRIPNPWQVISSPCFVSEYTLFLETKRAYFDVRLL